MRVGGGVKLDTFHFFVLIADETSFVIAFRRADCNNGIRDAGGLLDEATSENLTRQRICLRSSSGNVVE